jgi:hypothetical protein
MKLWKAVQVVMLTVYSFQLMACFLHFFFPYSLRPLAFCI